MSDDELEPLVTECPQCRTRFRVTETQLQVAAGRVRCGSCLTVFQGVDRLLYEKNPELPEGQAQVILDELLDELAQPLIEETPLAVEAIDIDPEEDVVREDGEEIVPALDVLSSGASLEETTGEADTGDVSLDDSGGDEQVREESLEVAVAAVADRNIQPQVDAADANVAGRVPIDDPVLFQLSEEFARAQALGEPVSFAPEKRFRWWVPPFLTLAFAALVAQVMWLQVENWTRDPTIRPLYEMACEFIGCELPVLRDLDRLLVKKLVVRSHPEVEGALIVDALIVNEAPFAQRFPVLELRFTSIEGDLVAGGRFHPGEYLAGELEGVEQIQPSIPVHIELEFVDPGSEAVNYFMRVR
ncbi:MAG: DUF3426 domain-containing protein [Gammaproteobacteria bacterium]|nr:DUF3426 domain-containing protein [Gammaproteobacteria bacterium]